MNISYCSDKYQYTMCKTFFDNDMHEKLSVFNLFYRSAPDKNNWAVVSGTREAIEMILGLGNMPESFFESFSQVRCMLIFKFAATVKDYWKCLCNGGG